MAPTPSPSKKSRQSTYYSKKSLDPLFRKSESIRKNEKQKQQRLAMTDDEKNEESLKNKLYQREYRKKLKEKKTAAALLHCITPTVSGTVAGQAACLTPRSRLRKKTGFSTKPSLLRAVRKLDKDSPKAVDKKIGAVTELARQYGLTVQSPVNDSVEPTTQSPLTLPCETVSLVTQFYFQTNIVYTSPGMKDEMTAYEKGKKVKLRRYYLELTLKEAHAVFKEEHPSVKISFTVFAKLRPENVKLLRDAPSDQCKCIHHENFKMLLKPAKINPEDASFWSSILCDSEDLNSDCWKADCGICSNGELLVRRLPSDEENETAVTWYMWRPSEKVTNKQGKESYRMRKDLMYGCMGEVKDRAMEGLGTYQRHCRTKKCMSLEFQNDLKRENTVIIQCDFAMDYNTKDNAQEIQSGIYNRKNVTIFTCAIHFEGKWKSYSVVTSSDKYKGTIRVCLLKILRHFMDNNDISEIHWMIMWSDGPSCEFRNQYITGKLLFELSRLIQRVCWWKYFAAGHGKGVCDGIGGALKARVSEHAKGKHRDEVSVQCSEDFYNLAKQYCPKVTLFFISKEEVDRVTEKDKPWEDAIPLPGISNVHVVKCGLDGSIMGWNLPGGEPLKAIRYIIEPEDDSRDEESSESVEAPAATPTEESVPVVVVNSTIEVGSWHIVTWKDNKERPVNYVCQIITKTDTMYNVRAYVSVAGSSKLIFKKYPEEESVTICQFLNKELEKPEILKSDKVKFQRSLAISVK